MDRVGIGSAGWVLLLPIGGSVVEVETGQGAVGGREQVSHVGWEWDGMVWVWVKKKLSWWVEVGGKDEGKGGTLSWWFEVGDKVEGKGGNLSW